MAKRFWENCLLVAAALTVTPAQAEEETRAVELSVAYTADSMATVAGGSDHRVRFLDKLQVFVDGDLDRLVGWRGATAHMEVLNSFGAMPNDSAGTLQGINNIEVPRHRLRLFEAWLEQRLSSRVSLRAGFYDVNSEFYQNDAAGLLLAPAFGIGSEMSATGPNGPSIFPSTALAVRLDAKVGGRGYVRAAMMNAQAGVLGDPGGADFNFSAGALGVVEAGIGGKSKLGIGYWRYTQGQDDIRETDGNGDPLRHVGHGVYMVSEVALTSVDKPQATYAFLRAGLSDGHSTPFVGGWQAGLLISELFTGTADSQMSIGVNQGFISSRHKANLVDAGIRPADMETQFEVTLAYPLRDFLAIQPDLQLTLDPGADADADPVVAAGLRISVDF